MSQLACPRCTAPLHARPIRGVKIVECASCQGVFLERATVDRVIAERQYTYAYRLLAALPKKMESPIVKPGQPMYIKCPVCQTLMNRKLFAAGAGAIIDVCKEHGTFFDAGELPAIIMFVMRGGLEKAAAKNNAEAERQLRMRRVEARARPSGRFDLAVDGGGAFVDLLLSLFS